jgi:UDPglucose--hexose-1-phosphate uridylyltransferase
VFEHAHHPHRRFNPLRNEWVIVSPRRNERPWQGTVDVPPEEPLVSFDPACYLCPGNARAGGARNPDYASTFVFDNDFPALIWEPEAAEAEVRLKPDATEYQRPERISTCRPPLGGPPDGSDLLLAEPEGGICRVVCFSPRHDLTLARMSVAAIRTVVDTWVEQWAELAGVPGIAYATIFENCGAMMGASNPHPHCQIWATEHIPNDPALELTAMTAYHARRGSCLLCDYVAHEQAAGERVVYANDAFVAVVPFWAAWPFETLVLSRRHIGELTALREDERSALADMLQRLTTMYNNVFETAFPYSMGFHQQPFHGDSAGMAHLHAHFYPPLLRSATVRKFMVGFELLGSPQRDFTPEDAARRMQALR